MTPDPRTLARIRNATPLDKLVSVSMLAELTTEQRIELSDNSKPIPRQLLALFMPSLECLALFRDQCSQLAHGATLDAIEDAQSADALLAQYYAGGSL